MLRNKVPPGGLEAKFDELTSISKARHDQRVQSSKAYTSRLRATMRESPRGHFFVNGQHLPNSSPQIFQQINKIVTTQLQGLLPQIYYKHLKDEDNLDFIFYDHPMALTSRSELLFPPIDSSSSVRHSMAVNLPAVMDSLDETAFTRNFLYPQGSDETSKINATVWVLGDFDSHKGKELILEGIDALSSSFSTETAFRLGFAHLSKTSGSSSTQGSNPQLLSTFLYQLISSSQIQKISPSQLREAVMEYQPHSDNLDQDGKIDARSQESQMVMDGKGKGFASFASEAGWQLPAATESEKFWRSALGFAKAFDMRENEFALTVNGKVSES